MRIDDRGAGWRNAPRWPAVGSYLALGWVSIFSLPVIWSDDGPGVVALIAAGGLVYPIGPPRRGLRTGRLTDRSHRPR